MAGSIIKRGEKTWLVRVYLGRNHAGKRLNHNKTIHGTKKDAERYLNQVLRDRDLGQLVEPARKSLDQYLDQWLETCKSVKPQTADHYRRMLELYVRPRLGPLRLDRLQRGQVQELYLALEQEGRSPATIALIHRVLRSALNQAVRWGFLAGNPSQGLELPRRRRRVVTVLEPHELERVLEAASSEPFWWFFLVFAVSTGMRPGELLACQWDQVDWQGSALQVTRNLIRRQEGETWRLEVDEVKTPAGNRRLQLGSELVRRLRAHRAHLAELRLQAGPKWTDHNLLFPNPTGGFHWRDSLDQRFKRLLKRVGLREMRLYTLRHTHAACSWRASTRKWWRSGLGTPAW
ncbi:MAG: site-specific integrase [Candidatus Xenobia bacterium]